MGGTSARFLNFPPAHRPAHLPAAQNRRRLGLGREASNTLEPLVPPAWPSPWSANKATSHLLQWTKELGYTVQDSSASHLHEAALCEADDDMLERMNRWLRGSWSDREALIELAWRLEIGDRCVSAALWLHDLAVASGGRPAER